MRRIVLLLPLLLALAAPGAVAQSPYELPEPVVSAPDVLKFPKAPAKCSSARRKVTLRVLTPPGLKYASLRVTLRSYSVRLGAVSEPATFVLPLSRGANKVIVSATTAKGRALKLTRTYRRCVPKKKPASRSGKRGSNGSGGRSNGSDGGSNGSGGGGIFFEGGENAD